MSDKLIRLPDSELEIMKTVWENGGSVTSADVLEKLKGKRDWKPTSVLTFLSRLADKGFVIVERQGKTNRYTALVDERAYMDRESRSLLERFYDNSLTSLVASLYESRSITEEDLRELRSYIDGKTEEA
jgi:predicted transcriptional regulator